MCISLQTSHICDLSCIVIISIIELKRPSLRDTPSTYFPRLNSELYDRIGLLFVLKP